MTDSTVPDPFDPTAFPEVDAAIASSPYTLKSGWLKGSDEEVLARIARVRWDPERDGDIVGKHLQAAIEADRSAVVRAMLAQGMPANLAWSPTLKARHPVSALRTALDKGSAATVTVLLEHGARLTVEEHRADPLVLRLLGQPARAKETPAQRQAREVEVLTALTGHPQMPRSPAVLVARAVADGVAVDVLGRLLDHGLASPQGAEGAHLLTTALRAGQPRLVRRLLERGARPDPQDEHPVAMAAQAPMKPREVLARWQHRAMRSIEALADAGLFTEVPDLPAPRPGVAPPSFTTGGTDPEPLDLGPSHDARWGGTPTDRLVPLLRLANAGVWPSRWWDALARLDTEAVDQALTVNAGACAAWGNLGNRNALHALVNGRIARQTVADRPTAPESTASAAARSWSGSRSRYDPSAVPPDAPANDDDHRAVTIARRLLAHGADPLRPANREEAGALWAALDLPCPALAQALFEAIPAARRGDLVHEAVVKRRSARTLVRLVAFGAPLDDRATPEGSSALHTAVARATFHDPVPLLLALGASPEVRDDAGRTPLDVAREAMAALGGPKSPMMPVFQALATLLETTALRRTLNDPQPPLKPSARPRL